MAQSVQLRDARPSAMGTRPAGAGRGADTSPGAQQRDTRAQRLGRADRARHGGIPRRQPCAGTTAGLALPARRHPQLRLRTRVDAAQARAP